MNGDELREWRNYWTARRGFTSRVEASLQIVRAVGARVRRRRGRPMVPPAYLSATDIHAAVEIRGTLARPPLPHFVRLPHIPKPLREWAEGHEATYRRFLDGDARRSSDPEDYWTLHQFGWLLALVLAGDAVSAEQARKYIVSWIERLGEASGDLAWRSFSISERLCNWVQLFELVDPDAAWPALAESMRAQAVHLARHLEGETEGGGANNHLISNGRGLYLTGGLLGLQELVRIGRVIVLAEAKRQITADGFLDEGSSHYQLIVTRDYLEVLAAARDTGDQESVEVLAPRIDAMLRACAFFLDDEAENLLIPFIGDISPDPPPCFFDTGMRFWEMTHQVLASFGGAKTIVETSVPWFAGRDDPGPRAVNRGHGWWCYPDSGYYRWDGTRFVTWWHTRRPRAPRRHAHNDWGSFQMHARGEPIFIDPGRESYRDAETGYDGRFTLAQNAVTVDGFEQALHLKRDLYVREYLDDSVEVTCDGGGDVGMLAMHISAYQRLREPVTHTRTFSLRDDGMAIADAFEGRGEHTLTAAFHLHPEVETTFDGEREVLITTPKGQRIRLTLAPGAAVSVKRGGLAAVPGGYCSVQYGTRRETTSIFAAYRRATPLTLEHRILVQ